MSLCIWESKHFFYESNYTEVKAEVTGVISNSIKSLAKVLSQSYAISCNTLEKDTGYRVFSISYFATEMLLNQIYICVYLKFRWWERSCSRPLLQRETERLTLGLLDTRSYTAQEIIRGHEYLVIPVITMHLQGCKVPKNLVWSWILPNTVLILNYLEIMVMLAWIYIHIYTLKTHENAVVRQIYQTHKIIISAAFSQS